MKPGALAPYVQSIRERYANGEVTQRELAREHGCTEQAISAIVCETVYNGLDYDAKPPKELPHIAKHGRICCDCRGTFHQHEYESVPFRAMVRCARCAEMLWRDIQRRRKLH